MSVNCAVLFILYYFHRIGPLGRFGLVVAMSIYLYICPLEHVFFSMDQVRIFAWTESAFWWGLGPHGALEWSPKNGDVFRIALFSGFSIV